MKLSETVFKLENVQAGAFAMAEKLFGLSFEKVDVEGWNPVIEPLTSKIKRVNISDYL